MIGEPISSTMAQTFHERIPEIALVAVERLKTGNDPERLASFGDVGVDTHNHLDSLLANHRGRDRPHTSAADHDGWRFQVGGEPHDRNHVVHDSPSNRRILGNHLHSGREDEMQGTDFQSLASDVASDLGTPLGGRLLRHHVVHGGELDAAEAVIRQAVNDPEKILMAVIGAARTRLEFLNPTTPFVVLMPHPTSLRSTYRRSLIEVWII